MRDIVKHVIHILVNVTSNFIANENAFNHPFGSHAGIIMANNERCQWSEIKITLGKVENKTLFKSDNTKL
jgi:hypothetical protein